MSFLFSLFFAVPVSSMMGLPLRWVSFAFRFYRGSFAESGSRCAWPLLRGGYFSQVKPESRHHRRQASVCSSVSASSQQRFGVTDIKAPSACHSSRVLDRSCYSCQVSNGRVIILRQISATALFYLEESRKIHLGGVKARQSRDTRRRAPQRAGESESWLRLPFMRVPLPGPALRSMGPAGRGARFP